MKDAVWQRGLRDDPGMSRALRFFQVICVWCLQVMSSAVGFQAIPKNALVEV